MRASVAWVAFLLLSVAPVRSQTVGPGTYRFNVCEPACSSTSQPIASGILVLFSDSATLAEAARTHNVRLGNRILRFRQNPYAGNACFKVNTRVRSVNDREFYFGIIPTSITEWTTGQDSVFLPVYTSPDASYTLTWPAPAVRRDTVTGVGIQSDCCVNRRGPFGQFTAVRVSD